eukprot:487830-Pleurochrysis_carterae.AAC.1
MLLDRYYLGLDALAVGGCNFSLASSFAIVRAYACARGSRARARTGYVPIRRQVGSHLEACFASSVPCVSS